MNCEYSSANTTKQYLELYDLPIIGGTRVIDVYLENDSTAGDVYDQPLHS